MTHASLARPKASKPNESSGECVSKLEPGNKRGDYSDRQRSVQVVFLQQIEHCRCLQTEPHTSHVTVQCRLFRHRTSASSMILLPGVLPCEAASGLSFDGNNFWDSVLGQSSESIFLCVISLKLAIKLNPTKHLADVPANLVPLVIRRNNIGYTMTVPFTKRHDVAYSHNLPVYLIIVLTECIEIRRCYNFGRQSNICSYPFLFDGTDDNHTIRKQPRRNVGIIPYMSITRWESWNPYRKDIGFPPHLNAWRHLSVIQSRCGDINFFILVDRLVEAVETTKGGKQCIELHPRIRRMIITST